MTELEEARRELAELLAECGCERRKLRLVAILRAAADWLETDYDHDVGAAIGTLLLAAAVFLLGTGLGLWLTS